MLDECRRQNIHCGNEGIRTPTKDTQSHPAGNTAACTLDYSELLGIMKQIKKRAQLRKPH